MCITEAHGQATDSLCLSEASLLLGNYFRLATVHSTRITVQSFQSITAAHCALSSCPTFSSAPTKPQVSRPHSSQSSETYEGLRRKVFVLNVFVLKACLWRPLRPAGASCANSPARQSAADLHVAPQDLRGCRLAHLFKRVCSCFVSVSTFDK